MIFKNDAYEYDSEVTPLQAGVPLTQGNEKRQLGWDGLFDFLFSLVILHNQTYDVIRQTSKLKHYTHYKPVLSQKETPIINQVW